MQVFCVDGQTSYQVKKTERSGTSCLCTFASSCRLASCAPVDLFLLYRASLIASFVFMESNFLLRIFSIFMTPLSISFFRSLYCYDCDKSVSSFSCVFFFNAKNTKDSGRQPTSIFHKSIFFFTIFKSWRSPLATLSGQTEYYMKFSKNSLGE